jgi:hypothetical protein
MDPKRYLELQRAELARLENALLTYANLAAQTRGAVYARGELQRRIKNQRQTIAIVEGARIKRAVDQDAPRSLDP